MSNQDDDLERLIRLRERQIQARDPKAKEREIQRKVTARRRKLRRKVTIQEMFQDMVGDIPYKLWGILIGTAIGIIISIVLALTVEASWAPLVGLASTVVLALIGFVLGHSLDWRDEMRDEIKDL